jgi:hypothetical protein
MSKSVGLIILVAVCAGIYFLVDNIKGAYKVIPITAKPTMMVVPFADWREFISTASGFKVSVPDYPQQASQAVPIPNTNKKRKYKMYASEKVDGTVFMISVITYPSVADLSPPAVVVEELISEMVGKNPNNHLEKITHTTFKGHEAVDFVIQNPERKVDGKVVVIGKVLYLLTYIAKNQNFSEDDYKHFIETFDFINKN